MRRATGLVESYQHPGRSVDFDSPRALCATPAPRLLTFITIGQAHTDSCMHPKATNLTDQHGILREVLHAVKFYARMMALHSKISARTRLERLGFCGHIFPWIRYAADATHGARSCKQQVDFTTEPRMQQMLRAIQGSHLGVDPYKHRLSLHGANWQVVCKGGHETFVFTLRRKPSLLVIRVARWRCARTYARTHERRSFESTCEDKMR